MTEIILTVTFAFLGVLEITMRNDIFLGIILLVFSIGKTLNIISERKNKNKTLRISSLIVTLIACGLTVIHVIRFFSNS